MSTERKSTIQTAGSRKTAANIIQPNEIEAKKSKMSSALDQLKSMTVVVADTGDFECKYCLFNFISTRNKIIIYKKIESHLRVRLELPLPPLKKKSIRGSY